MRGGAHDRAYSRRVTRMYLVAIAALACACGSSAPSSKPVATTNPSEADRAAAAARQEQARRARLAEAQNARLDEQATALAATCARPAAAKRCTPGCYASEPADARAGKPLRGPVAIEHRVCTRDVGDAGPYLVLDELLGDKLAIRKARGRFPRPARRGWQAALEAEVTKALAPDLARGDVVVVAGRWQSMVHPASAETLRCVTVTRYTRAAPRPLDACGSHGKIACEAAGNAAAHGLNLVQYRLAEAARLEASGDVEGCQAAALDAIATARGLPRWRQYMMLNVDKWKASPRYRTRFDGIVDEDALFARAIELGTRAGRMYVECGGSANPQTTAAQEQAFHSCP